MASVRQKSVVLRDRKELWNSLLDPAIWLESFAPIIEFKYESMPMQFQNGGVYKFEARRWKLGQEWQLECHRNDAQYELLFLQKHGPFKSWQMKMQIKEHGEGQFLLEESIQYSLPMLFLGGLVDDLFLGGDMHSLLKNHQEYFVKKA